MVTFDEWHQRRRDADAQAAAASADVAAQLTDLGPGFWMVSVAGDTRGFITQIEVRGELRFEARLRHLNPGQGMRIGEYWELERAIAAIVAEPPRVTARDPFKELTNYASRSEMADRTERMRQRRKAGFYG